MVRFARQGRASLYILLFATFVGSSGCSTGGPPNPDDEVTSQDADETDETATADEENANAELGTQGDQANNLTNEENGKAEVPASTAVPVEATPVVEGRGYVGGKAGSPMTEGLPEEGSKMAYIVQPGDTLSKISKRIFSDMNRWRELAAASAVKNPNLIYPGDVIFYQLDSSSVAFAKRYENKQREETPVKSGESLSDVSKRIYGNSNQWAFLWRMNEHIGNPNALEAGTSVYYVSPDVLDSFSDSSTAKAKMNTEIVGAKKSSNHLRSNKV